MLYNGTPAGRKRILKLPMITCCLTIIIVTIVLMVYLCVIDSETLKTTITLPMVYQIARKPAAKQDLQITHILLFAKEKNRLTISVVLFTFSREVTRSPENNFCRIAVVMRFKSTSPSFLPHKKKKKKNASITKSLLDTL